MGNVSIGGDVTADTTADMVKDEASASAIGASLPVAEGGGVLSPLSGAYLLIVLSEPISEAHKEKMLGKLKQGR